MKLSNQMVIFLLLCITHFSWATTAEVNQKISISLGTEYQFHSKILNEKRDFFVHLPKDYQNSTLQYPVIYVLDGQNHFQHSVSAVTLLQKNDRIPESILVAIPNNPGSRFRDLFEQKEKFLQFIEKELVPQVNKNYRTTHHNTLFGHSLAGYFTLYTMSENHNVFKNYIAASPHLTVSEGELETKLTQQFNNKNFKHYQAYMTMTDAQGDGVERVKSINNLVNFLETHASDKLTWKYHAIEEQVHMTTPYLTMYQGLSYIFKDFQMPRFSSYDEFQQQGGMKAITSFYEKRSTQYALDKNVPQAMIRSIASLLFAQKDFEAAIQLLKNSATQNPASMRAHFDLARFYQRSGDDEQALNTYISARSLLTESDTNFSNFIERQIKALSQPAVQTTKNSPS